MKATIRTAIAYEGKVTNAGGWHLLKNSLIFPDDRIPVYIGSLSAYENLVGHASDLQRDEAGEVTALIEFKDRPTIEFILDKKMTEINDHFDVSIYGDQLETKTHWTHRPIVVDRVRVRAVVILPLPTLPMPNVKENKK